MFATTNARATTGMVAIAALITAITALGWHREHANHGGSQHAAHTKAERTTPHRACGHAHADTVEAPTPPDRNTPSLPPPHSDDDSCAICLTINLPTGDGLPLSPISPTTAPLVEPFVTAPVDTPVVAFLPVLWKCGPPMAATLKHA